MAASHRVTLHCGGKKPATRRIAVQCDTDEEAAFCAMQWVVWSHAKGRPRKLPRYTQWRVEALRDNDIVLVREGTYDDAKKECPQEDTAETIIGTVQSATFSGSAKRQSTAKTGRQGRNKPKSRLAALVERTLANR